MTIQEEEYVEDEEYDEEDDEDDYEIDEEEDGDVEDGQTSPQSDFSTSCAWYIVKVNTEHTSNVFIAQYAVL